MTFNTEKNKIFKIWNDSVSNQFQITNQINEDKIVLSKINDLNRTNIVYNNIITLGSGWITPDFRLDDDGDLIEIFKEYSVEINGINENLIPYISSKLSYRLGGSGISIPIPDSTSEEGTPFDENANIEFNDIVERRGSNVANNVNIVYRTSVYLKNLTGLPEGLELNFYINLVNPKYYQST